MAKNVRYMKIGIDPDVDKSGLAMIDGNNVFLGNLDLVDLFEYLLQNKHAVIYIEAGWLISNNFTANAAKGVSVSTKLSIANKAGINFGTGIQIEKFCIKKGLSYKLVRPLKKVWGQKNGKNLKISHEQFMNIWQVKRLLPDLKKTNQEQRDAMLLIL